MENGAYRDLSVSVSKQDHTVRKGFFLKHNCVLNAKFIGPRRSLKLAQVTNKRQIRLPIHSDEVITDKWKHCNVGIFFERANQMISNSKEVRSNCRFGGGRVDRDGQFKWNNQGIQLENLDTKCH